MTDFLQHQRDGIINSEQSNERDDVSNGEDRVGNDAGVAADRQHVPAALRQQGLARQAHGQKNSHNCSVTCFFIIDLKEIKKSVCVQTMLLTVLEITSNDLPSMHLKFRIYNITRVI